ncbi:RagB/SusD family nutrient uptake outer membrane protein [Chitinophaga qingshengii]|uniref:RagB/SusD family nutrient uptake outer membrane protein n=1 Tax=Chitinophaga qingshengii TaxID=1569794 RepID=A0ABR7TI48_9BACT|nr:RagB/SusD family nutrient uptake outer membrane protein [Chitinophaga qingshengii]MBC9929186.1 RagB/SusD family nutrient uptake outer membrane protein [Chitinophaga qingshengii]
MKRYSCYIYACLLLMISAACNRQLDLKPEGTMVEADLLKNKQTTENFLAGTYLQLMKSCAGNTYLFGDVTGNVVSSSNQNLIKGTIDPRDGNYDAMWSVPYATINQANVIITQLQKYAEFDIAIQQQFIAEAKFIRALGHLTLLQLYGDGALQGKPNNMGIPLMMQSFDGYDGSQDKARNTNEEVYTQILKDLDEAIAVLPETRTNPVDQASRATKGAAAALAARACMYKQDYAKAAVYANVVLSGQRYNLQPSFLALWPDNATGNGKYALSSEIIFAFPESWNATIYGDHGIFYAYYPPLPDFLAIYEAKDERLTDLKTATGKMRKFTDPKNMDNVNIIRLPEVMLTAAEALAQTSGVNPASVDLLNKVYARAYTKNPVPKVYTVADFTSKQQLVDRILLERKRELAFEGFARFDAIRSGKQPNPQLPANRYAMPIPQREIDITGGLIVQNPGYVQ